MEKWIVQAKLEVWDYFEPKFDFSWMKWLFLSIPFCILLSRRINPMQETSALTQRETITQQCAASCNELIFWSLRSINLNHSPNGWRGETGRAGKSLFVSGKTILLEVGWILRSSGSVNVKEARLRGKLCRLPRRKGLLHCKIVFGTSLLTESWRHSIIAARMHDFSLRLDLRVPANFARLGQRFSIHCLIFQDKYFLYVRVIDRLNYTG